MIPSARSGGSPTRSGSFREYWGTVVLSGACAPTGSVVEAFTPRGDLVGSTTLVADCHFGFLRVYGEDATASPPISGMRSGEPVLFKVNGWVATTSAPVRWEAGFEPAEVDLRAGHGVAVDEALASLKLADDTPAYDYVLGEGGTYAVSAPYPGANSLASIEPGRGYFVRMRQPAELVLRGERLPVSAGIALESGWRWIGYLPEAARDLPAALSSVDGHYDYLLGESGTYAPLGPSFLNSLASMEPGKGYLIRITGPAILEYGP